jgi:transcriptional regulator GlxA family with amidase domain
MNIGIYLYDDAEVLDFSGPFEVFSTAKRLSDLRWNIFFIAETNSMVTARGGLQLLPHYGIDNHPPLDLLLIVGGDHNDQMAKTNVIDWIGKQASQANRVATVCTGAFLLAQTGLLDDRLVTTHWQDVNALTNDFPALKVAKNIRWIEDGKYISSAGISAGIDMSLHLVSLIVSQKLANKTAKQMDYAWDH